VAIAQTSAFEHTRRLRGDALAFVLPRESEMLATRAQASSSGRAAKTLVKEGQLRVTLVALKAGTSLQQHKTAGPSTIQALGGMSRVETEAGTTVLTTGGLMVLDAGVAHGVTALEHSIILVSLVAVS
jgi:quercetin dioxygenase-like cupin family protein